jgi:hypothetical protein
MSNNKYSDEDRARIFEAAREALEAAEVALSAPRPEVAWPPPSEDRVQRAARLAGERAAAQLAERREWSLTESEAQNLEHRLAGLVGEQKDFFMQLLAELVAEVRAEFEQKVGELSAEIGQLRAEQTIAKAYSNNNKSGDVVDLPTLPLRRRA